jgi:hypothetical protein
MDLGMILQFATGADCIPAQGFQATPHIVFAHDAQHPLPKSNTCLNLLKIPVQGNADFETFTMNFTSAIIGSLGFGEV